MLHFITLLFSALCAPTPSVIDLSSHNWIVTNRNGSISVPASVPGEVHMDLLGAGIIGDPYYRFGDLDYRWITMDNWTYSTVIEVGDSGHSYLLFSGIQTVADIYLDEMMLGSADNEFRSWMFPEDIEQSLRPGNYNLSVRFTSSPMYAAWLNRSYDGPEGSYPKEPNQYINGLPFRNYLRLEQSSFGWDWGPAFAPQGISKSVSLIQTPSISGRGLLRFLDLTIHTFPCRNSSVPLSNDNNCFNIRVDFYFDATSVTNESCDLHIWSDFGLEKEFAFKRKLQSAEQLITSWVTAINVPLWWPTGYGPQPLQLLNVSMSCGSSNTITGWRRFGFRVVELLTKRVSGDPAMVFRINNQELFAKGANWIPADAFQSRVTNKVIANLLESAAEANMNMLRVWGGGLYEKDYFYEWCDENGMLVWQEMIFACDRYPTNKKFLKNVREEIKHQIRRLSSHPSIVMWSGNNEDEWPFGKETSYTVLNYETVLDQITREDVSRPVWASSPSSAPTEGTTPQGLPSGTRESPKPIRPGGIAHDNHHYNYNKCTELDSFPLTQFASEYGFQSLPSLETLGSVSVTKDHSMFSPFMLSRQHHPNGQEEIVEHLYDNFRTPDLNDTSVAVFRRWIYLSQVLQSLCIGTEAEFYRRQRYNKSAFTMGSLYWQLNQNWQAPSWTGLEYGGRWKILHHKIQSVYAQLMVSSYSGTNGLGLDLKGTYTVQIVSDLLIESSGKLEITLLNVFDGSSVCQTVDYKIPPAGTWVWTTPSANLITKCGTSTQCLILLRVYGEKDKNYIISENIFWTLPMKDMDLMPIKSQKDFDIEFKSVSKEDKQTTISMTIESQLIAPYTTLSSPIPGHWSNNGFLILPSEVRNIEFKVFGKFDVKKDLPAFLQGIVVDCLNFFWK